METIPVNQSYNKYYNLLLKKYRVVMVEEKDVP